MSGGEYNYAYSKINQFIDEMAVAPKQPDETNPSVNYELRKRFKTHLVKVAQAMRAIEWNDSDDGDRRESELIMACLWGENPDR